jgi:ABC-type phosphate transport system auxiliary subunit
MGIKTWSETRGERRSRLATRLQQINAEIRDYPQPIARCDAQLGGLVEERASIQAELEALEAELKRSAVLQGW